VRSESREVLVGGGWNRSSDEASVMGAERRVPRDYLRSNHHLEQSMSGTPKVKTQKITKKQVWEAWKLVKRGGKSEGLDQLSMSEIERNPRKYLYPLWNRLASGSYQPPPVKQVTIPKGNGGIRKLGIPTILDRVAQKVIAKELEKDLEPRFLESSYGYRPNRSAHDALEMCAKNCGERRYVVDLDIKGFFDNIGHSRMMWILRQHTQEKHILLYTERWLKAGIMQRDGTLVKTEKGTPQGGVLSPLLANLFLHEAFDLWMHKTHSNMVYERYADDIVVHTRSREQSEFILDKIRQRLKGYGLALNEEKTKIVYCYRSVWLHKEPKEFPKSFDFLGYTFKPRLCKRKDGKLFWSFFPAISAKNQKRILEELRSLAIWNWVTLNLKDIAKRLSPQIRGWLYYYGKFGSSVMRKVFWKLNTYLVKWAQKKYKKNTYGNAYGWLKRVIKSEPKMFPHWEYGFKS
jgi:group II intron reverse transcriptase/maturase